MNTDYRISVGFFRHHKTRKLQKRLGSDGVLALLKLWGYAAEFRSDGDLSEMSAEDIELAIDWMKETPLIATLVEIGFVDGQEGRYCLHEWQEHNPWAAKEGSRSDKARFSRIAKTHPEIYKEMREKGINEISAIDYEKLTNATKKQRKNNERLTIRWKTLTIRQRFVPNRLLLLLLLLLLLYLLQKKKRQSQKTRRKRPTRSPPLLWLNRWPT